MIEIPMAVSVAKSGFFWIRKPLKSSLMILKHTFLILIHLVLFQDYYLLKLFRNHKMTCAEKQEQILD